MRVLGEILEVATDAETPRNTNQAVVEKAWAFVGSRRALQFKASDSIRLVELELTQRLVRSLTDNKMLASSKNVAQAALQWICVEEGAASCCLERDGGYMLSNFYDVR